VAQRAKEAIVDYGDLSPFERNVVRRSSSCTRGRRARSKYAGHFLRDHPVQAAALGSSASSGSSSDEAFGAAADLSAGADPGRRRR
jgi:hypothetical protein